MDAMADNFYILLELPFDPPVTDPARIKAALHKKKQEWTRWQENPGKRGAGLKYLDMAPEIQRVMLDPVLRAQQAAAAAAQRSDMLRQFEAELRILETKGHLTNREAAAIAVKYKAWGVVRDTVHTSARVPITDTPRSKAPAEDAGEILDRLTARTVDRNLTVLGLPDLYTFLEEQPYSSIKKLQAAAEAKRRAAQQSAAKNAAATASQELAGLCLQIFESFDAKQRYDRYLRVSKYPVLGGLIDDEYARSKYISTAVLLRLVNFGVEKYAIGVLEAEDYVRRYCIACDIPIGSLTPAIPCPACGTEVARASAMCTSCGTPLRGECPGCGSPFSEGPAVCGDCGFSIGEMGKALHYIAETEAALIENNWSTAQRSVQYAYKHWPGHPRIEPLQKRVRSLSARYAQYVDSIGDCVRHNQYYAALELIDEALARRFRLPGSTVTHVRNVIEALETEIAALTKDGAEPPIESVLELSGKVGDSIELSRMMKTKPPLPPSPLHVSIQGTMVRLDWHASTSPGLIGYVLVRKKGGFPLTAFDGDILCEGPANYYEDKSAQSLTEYYYSVFSKRGGSYSQQGTSAGPVLIVPEIQGLRIVPIDQGCRITWDFNPHIREVTIWRKLGGEQPTAQGEGIKLDNDRADGFNDHRIKNDVDYWYYLSAVYEVDDRRIYSQGVCGRVTPHKFLAPVDQLLIAKGDGGEDDYVVSWKGAEHSEMLLFASPKKPAHRPGEIVPVEDLITRHRRLDMIPRGADSATFSHAFNGGVYIFAAVLFGKFATAGQSTYLTNVKNVENPTYDVIGGELYINMKWPAGQQEAAICYRFDRAPQLPGETGSTLLFTTKEQYDYDAALVLREPENTTYYTKLYSVFRTPDGATVFSDGVELVINNIVRQEIFYQFRYKKKMFRGGGNVSLTISSDTVFTMPKAVLVGKIGRMPLNKSDGMPLFEIEKEIRVNGQVTYQYNTGALPEDLYIRLFLRDEEDYGAFHLLPLDSAKIT